MRIYKMTATFGKLEHEILTLEPGLNIITAPNEWGKEYLVRIFGGDAVWYGYPGQEHQVGFGG